MLKSLIEALANPANFIGSTKSGLDAIGARPQSPSVMSNKEPSNTANAKEIPLGRSLIAIYSSRIVLWDLMYSDLASVSTFVYTTGLFLISV